ncbi:putative metalloprotease CJM1_0395 family protein [Azospirillum sp. TSO22-1]|uniref:putative metalloprotease CJM1_0395 family protein n=1 Tax=Azospirillum sp. TSO22-1 TaxID=716789 RepID=UPI000D654CF4|nr:putative metalloprotease CJM1_0395 family protein [Azospirillum sp. TSO22-1]
MDIPRIGYGALYRPPQVGFGRTADGAQDAAETSTDTKTSGTRTSSPQATGDLKAPGTPLSDDEQKQVDKLKAVDTKVRQHEAAHQAAGGALAGGATFTYTKGPDGRSYATGGEVPVRAPAARSPEAAIQQAQQIKAAALAPAEPSGQDLAVAASADAAVVQAQRELNASDDPSATAQAGTAPQGGEKSDGTAGGGRPAAAAGSRNEPQPGLPTFPAPGSEAATIPALVARGVAAYGAAARINAAPRSAAALFA